MAQVTTSEARDDLSGLLHRAGKGERVVVTQRGHRVAAVVSLEDLDLLERLEDAYDVVEAREALADPDRIDWTSFKKRLRL